MYLDCTAKNKIREKLINLSELSKGLPKWSRGWSECEEAVGSELV